LTGLPASQGKSNSFDYIPFKVIDGFVLDHQQCTAHELCLSKAATSRIVIVVLKRRFVLARTNTGDFDEAEIRHVVHDCGQLYRDISDKPSITDFYTDVTQFVLSPTCRSCPSFPTCSACYVPASQSYFSQDEAWLQAKIASFTGRVLDVGMGQVPYLVGAADKIQSGTLSILGLDPDPAAAGLDAGIQVHIGTIEAFDAEPASFDHAIAIRSLNHFEDPAKALEVLAKVIKPGGSLVLIESLPLPLIRTKKQADTSHELAQGGFQHLRNWDSYPVLELISKLPFKVEWHRPISPDTCDQWIIVAKRLD